MKKLLLLFTGLAVCIIAVANFLYSNWWEYHKLFTGKWIPYKNDSLRISFNIPDKWEVMTGNSTACTSGSALVIGKYEPYDRLFICKNPNEIEVNNLLNENRFVHKDITTRYTSFTSLITEQEQKQGLNITRYLISNDRLVLIEVSIPPLSDTPNWDDAERDKLFLKVVNSIQIN